MSPSTCPTMIPTTPATPTGRHPEPTYLRLCSPAATPSGLPATPHSRHIEPRSRCPRSSRSTSTSPRSCRTPDGCPWSPRSLRPTLRSGCVAPTHGRSSPHCSATPHSPGSTPSSFSSMRITKVISRGLATPQRCSLAASLPRSTPPADTRSPFGCSQASSYPENLTSTPRPKPRSITPPRRSTNRATHLVREATATHAPWLAALGPEPAVAEQARAWRTAVTAVATYRDRWDITDDQPLGDWSGADRTQRRDRARAQRAIDVIASQPSDPPAHRHEDEPSTGRILPTPSDRSIT